MRAWSSTPLALVAVLACQGGATAQTAPARSEQAQCPVSLPHAAGTFRRCAPSTAAAYDFAFCSVFSRLPNTLSAADGQALRQKGMEYGNLSVALSDVETYGKNADLAKAYFNSLPGTGPRKDAALAAVRKKCGVLEAWHATTLDELSARMKARAGGGR